MLDWENSDKDPSYALLPYVFLHYEWENGGNKIQPHNYKSNIIVKVMGVSTLTLYVYNIQENLNRLIFFSLCMTKITKENLENTKKTKL